jgi:hypothetical protein
MSEPEAISFSLSKRKFSISPLFQDFATPAVVATVVLAVFLALVALAVFATSIRIPSISPFRWRLTGLYSLERLAW